MNKITSLINQLRKHTTIKGNLILDELISELVKKLEEVSTILEQPKEEVKK